MKKYSLTLILVLCLFVITGGTYATWTYYEAHVANGSQTGSAATLEDASIVSRGSITVTGADSVVINIDVATDSYNAELTVTNGVTVTFNATEDTHGGNTESLSAKWYIKAPTAQYDNKPIFTQGATTAGGVSNLIEGGTLTLAPGVPSTIANTELEKAITLNGDIVLSDSTKYSAFNTAISTNNTFTIYIVDTNTTEADSSLKTA